MSKQHICLQLGFPLPQKSRLRRLAKPFRPQNVPPNSSWELIRGVKRARRRGCSQRSCPQLRCCRSPFPQQVRRRSQHHHEDKTCPCLPLSSSLLWPRDRSCVTLLLCDQDSAALQAKTVSTWAVLTLFLLLPVNTAFPPPCSELFGCSGMNRLGDDA